ncbi:MAG: hypothetical protein Q4G25_01085 [Paracoccus sp. (in: a-proteobacteria)]|nr:hypothetical protein [Paracoccus sp. (in: a-proteobacteria)]
MRGDWIAGGVALLLLAGCGENDGWNPNYRYPASPYGQYLQEREAALQGQAAMPRVIPVTEPRRAPTPAEITGQPILARTQPAAATAAVSAPEPARIRPAQVAQPYAGDAGQTALARYAQAMQHRPGTRLWQRPGGSEATAMRACRSYASADAAQLAFIAAGGPATDTLGLDPDGDGYVCGWVPAPAVPAPAPL